MKTLRFVVAPTRNRRLNELLGLLMLVAASLLLLAIVSYRPTDPSLNTAAAVVGRHPAQNWAGVVGATISDLLLQVEGVTALWFPVLLGMLGVSWIRSRPAGAPGAKLAGALLILLFGPAAIGLIGGALIPSHMRWMHGLPMEGLTGRLVGDFLAEYLNFPGACIVAVTMVAAALYLSTTFSFNTAKEWLAVRLAFVQAWRDRWANWKAARARKRELRLAVREDAARAKAMAKAQKAAAKTGKIRAKGREMPHMVPVASARAADEAEEMPGTRKAGFAEIYNESAPRVWDEVPEAQAPDFDSELEAEAEPQMDAEPTEQPRPQLLVPRRAEPVPAAKPDAARVEPLRVEPKFDSRAIAVGERADLDIRGVTLTPKSVSGFRLPPSTLLTRSEDSQAVREDELRIEAQVLVEKCGEFDVRGQVVQINPGPVVTTFEFRPDAGVKYSRVTGLAEDLCLAMRAESILIERMAGKSTVGIQVPNHHRETIWLRDVIESEVFLHTKSKLALAMGKDINGRIVVADLATMPHVLIAGSTGSGKSVAINAMIMSVLYKSTPEQVRMILVDPKRVELGMYEGIPHLFTPIITEPKLAANALKNAVREMERRLKLLASRSVRNIDQYNKLFENGTPSLFEDSDEQEPLPYILIIIDELADLMMLDKANVEEAITRLAQMARAVGIHLILATQRPSVDVITGLIKANVPTRMSFRLATKVDSRTILDSNGAEALLGRGDMLFLPPGTSRVQRVHAPFVTEKETAAVVDFWKNQAQAEYVESFLESPKDDKGRDLDDAAEEADGNDELYEDGVRLVLEFGKASTSLLQRRLRIGYGRAAHLIDMMERDGIVGPADGSKPREILKPPDWLSQVEAAMR